MNKEAWDSLAMAGFSYGANLGTVQTRRETRGSIGIFAGRDIRHTHMLCSIVRVTTLSDHVMKWFVPLLCSVNGAPPALWTYV